MVPVPIGGEWSVDEENLVGGRVRVDRHAGGAVNGVLCRGPQREEFCVLHEEILDAESERVERGFAAQVAQDVHLRRQWARWS
jgi:hypothetical protein